jgi:archaetidylinositol phosphate synthase
MTARRSSMDQGVFFARWSELHGGAEIQGIVKWWLKISYRSARLLQYLRLTADGLTIIGVLLSAGLLVALIDVEVNESRTRLLLALLLLLLALAADGVDGSLALITGRASRRGAALDAIADRIAEALWALSFILLGAEPLIVMLAWLFAQIQEYIRARLGGLGVTEIGVVTLCERPVRASILAVALVAGLIFAILGVEEILSGTNSYWVSLLASFWLLLQAFALFQLSKFAISSTVGSR